MDTLLERCRQVKSWPRWTGSSSLTKRKRTAASTTTGTPEEQKQTDQSHSSFLGKLPLEIRVLIYKQILLEFGHKQHISLDDDGLLLHSPCIGTQTTYLSRDLQRYWGPWGHNHNICLHLSRHPQRDASMLPLLQSCRQIYDEAISLHYSTTQFLLVDLAAAHRFLTHVPTTHLHTIRTLHLSWFISSPCYLTTAQHIAYGPYQPQEPETLWTSIWRSLSSLPSLQELDVHIYAYDFQIDERRLLAPLWGARAALFQVDCVWLTDYDARGEGAPFVLAPLTDGDPASVDLTFNIHIPVPHWTRRCVFWPFSKCLRR